MSVTSLLVNDAVQTISPSRSGVGDQDERQSREASNMWMCVASILALAMISVCMEVSALPNCAEL